MGISTAYFLAKKGQRDVLLLEKDLLAQASTGLCAGGVRQQFSHPANILLSRETIGLLLRFEQEFHEPLKFHRVGYLFLARKEEIWGSLRNAVSVQQKLGVPVQELTPDQIKKRWPYLETQDLAGGAFCPEDGYVDPYRTAMAMARSARGLGIRFRERTKVTGIRMGTGKIQGVETSEGPVLSKWVVNAAGAWAREVGAMAGVDLPVLPYRRQVFVTRPQVPFPAPVPMIIDQDALFYFRGDGRDILTGMTDPSEPPSFHTHTDRDFLEKLTASASHRVPALEKASVLKGWAGLYAVTPDENPIIGPIPGVPGMVCAVGFSGHGFQHGPAVGRILSDILTEGSTKFDLSAFSLRRLREGKKTLERITV